MLSAANPIDRVGAGEGEFLGMGAESLSDRIRPDINCDIFEGIGKAENVVVEAHLPEAAVGQFVEFECGTRLENADKFEQIGAVVRTLGKEMQVVGHQAIGVKNEERFGGTIG